LKSGEIFETPRIFLGSNIGGPDAAANAIRSWVKEVLNNQDVWKDFLHDSKKRLDADGRILAAFSSEPHSGDAQWHQLIAAGLSPTGTCIIGVDMTNAGTSGLSGTLDDALLLLHPGILSADGVPSFQTPQPVSAWR
jgi:hypothetical protein